MTMSSPSSCLSRDTALTDATATETTISTIAATTHETSVSSSISSVQVVNYPLGKSPEDTFSPSLIHSSTIITSASASTTKPTASIETGGSASASLTFDASAATVPTTVTNVASTTVDTTTTVLTAVGGNEDGLDSSRFFCPSFKVCPEDESLYEITSPFIPASCGGASSSSSSASSPHGGSASSLVKAFRRGSIVSSEATSSQGHGSGSISGTAASAAAASATSMILSTGNPLYSFTSPILKSDHKVCLIPINSKSASDLDPDTIRMLCSGTYALHLEEETGRSSIVFIMIEQSLSVLVWCRGSTTGFKAAFSSRDFSSPSFSRHKSQHTAHLFPKGLAYVSREMQERLQSMVSVRFDSSQKGTFLTGLEEGYIDLLYAREVSICESKIDLSGIIKRSGLKTGEVDCCSCLRLTYGSSISDNRKVEFILSRDTCSVWSRGMSILLRELDKQKKLCDQRLLWLKLKYLQLYYTGSKPCSFPTPAEAIKAFGGRKWALSDAVAPSLPPSSASTSIFSQHNTRGETGHPSSYSSPSRSRPSSTSSSIGSPSKIGNIIGAKGKLLKKKKSTPSFSLFSSDSGESRFGDKRTASPSPSLPHQYHKYSISEEPFSRRSLRFSFRKVSARHSFSFLSHFRNRRDSSAEKTAGGGDLVPPLLDPTNAVTRQHLLQSLRTATGGIQDDPVTTTSTSSVTSKTSEISKVSNVKSEPDDPLKAAQRRKPPTPPPHPSTSLLSRGKDLKRARGWFGSQKNLLMSFDGSSSASSTPVGKIDPVKQTVRQSITHSSTVNFIEFKELYRSFMIRSRADIKDLFDKLCQSSPTVSSTTIGPLEGGGEVITASPPPPSSMATSVIKDSHEATTLSPLTTSAGNEQAERTTVELSSSYPVVETQTSIASSSTSHVHSLSSSIQSHHVGTLSTRSTLVGERPLKEGTTSTTTTNSKDFLSDLAVKQQTRSTSVDVEHSHFPSDFSIKDVLERKSPLTSGASMTSAPQSSTFEPSTSETIVPAITGISTVFASMSSSSVSGHHVITTVSESSVSQDTSVSEQQQQMITARSPVTTPSSPTPSPTRTVIPTCGGSSLASSDGGSVGLVKRHSIASTVSADSSRRGSLFQESSSLLSHHKKTALQHNLQQQQQQQGSKSPKRRSSLAVGTLGASVSGGVLTTGLLTRNHSDSTDDKTRQRSLIWDAIASASIVSNSTGVDTTANNQVLSLENFYTFLRVYQREEGLTLDQVKDIIQRHEPDVKLRAKHSLSFEGFACYLTDKENYAFSPEQNTYIEDDLNETFSHYYMATSHNTYLTGHQLKGDSSVEMYSHVLKTGCRCVELDCWDGEDGFPVIYHGHTLTSKISFRKVIEAINASAFVTSPFPVILSLENHCSLPQQSKMAQTFMSVFADKLVTQFMFDSDFTDDPRLPSPTQLKYKILIKNKKLRTSILPAIHHKIRQAMGSMTTASVPVSSSTSPATPASTRRQPNRTDSLLSVDSSGSLNDEDDESDDEEEDDDDDLLTSTAAAAVVAPFHITTSSSAATAVPSTTTRSKTNPHRPSLRTESSSSQEGSTIFTSELVSLAGDVKDRERTSIHQGNEMSVVSTTSIQSRQHHSHQMQPTAQQRGSATTTVPFGQKDATGRKSSQVAPELSDLVNYVQAVKFRGLFFDSKTGLITSRPPQAQLPQQQQQQLQSSRTGGSSSSLPQAKRSSGSGKRGVPSALISSSSNVVAGQSSIGIYGSTNSPAITTTTTIMAVHSATFVAAPSSTMSGSNSLSLSTKPPAFPAASSSFSTVLSLTNIPPPTTCSGDLPPSSPAPTRTTLTTTTTEMHSSSSSSCMIPSSEQSSAPMTAFPSTMQQSHYNNQNLEIQEDTFVSRDTIPSTSYPSSTIDTESVSTQGLSGQHQHQQQPSATSQPSYAPDASERNSRQYANPCAPCYQVPSLNEHTAKKLCRKSPLPVIAFTESQLMRSYPAGMRIDSSNFNPLTFWAFGLQMAAINYQTEDMGNAINTAFFEQNGSCGLIKKPAVMIDPNHVMFGRFNPWEKEFDGLYALDLTITVISGQYVCPESNTGSPLVEVELIGIPVDCSKQRTTVVPRNSFNPIFNETFLFRVTFSDLAFIRFAVIDATSNHITAQRIIPINCLKPGYRHVRLRSPTNQPLATSSLFIYSSSQEEGIEVDVDPESNDDIARNRSMKQTTDQHQLHYGSSASSSIRETPSVPASVPTRRRMFFLVVHGVVPEEPSTILKITQDSTTIEVIAQALIKGNKTYEKEFDYVLIEEVASSWNKKQLLKKQHSTVQRILDADERPLEAQAKWKGEGRFILKKISDDPSTRAWMSTIKAATIRKEKILRRQDSDNVDEFSSWNDDHLDNFLVCVYNVSPDQPYTILKASSTSTAQEIIQRALLKARRIEDSQNYVILEEVEQSPRDVIQAHHHRHHYSSPSKNLRHVPQKRILADDEVLFDVQSKWTSKGLFRLVPRGEAIAMIEKDSRPKSFIRWAQTAKGSFRKISRMSSYARSKESSTDRDSLPGKSDSLESQASSV